MDVHVTHAVSNPPRVLTVDQVRRVRVIGFTGTGVSFLVSQLGLLWVLASGGIGNNPSVAGTIWLFSTLAAVFFLILVADSYRRNPQWIAAPERAG